MQVSDFVCILQNAIHRSCPVVDVKSSRMIEALAKALVRSGFLWSADPLGESSVGTLRLVFKTDSVGEFLMRGIRVGSKSGLRVYVKKSDVKPILQGFGAQLISSSRGVITDKEARQLGVGGELLCTVW